jgi:iron(III) transport system substrate-binding protein
VKTIAVLAAALALAPGRAAAAAAAPRTDHRIVDAAREEGRVVVYATADAEVVAPLLADFADLHPDIAIEYHDLQSGEIHERILAEVASGAGKADVAWSSSMDLQMKLANDGAAAPYRSPEAGQLPPWAVWKAEAYGTTFEPLAFVYNKRLLREDEVPRSHAELAKVLRARRDRFAGKVATYDPERSGIGFLLMTQHERIDPSFAEQARAFGGVGVRLHTSTAEMLAGVRKGEHVLAVNVLSSYALARPHEDVGIVYPRDYTLVLSRVALVPRSAPHPNAARVFLDYLLSQRGQEVLANRVRLGAIRADVGGGAPALARGTPLAIGASLLVYLDAEKKREFLRRWRRAMAGE